MTDVVRPTRRKSRAELLAEALEEAARSHPRPVGPPAPRVTPTGLGRGPRFEDGDGYSVPRSMHGAPDDWDDDHVD